MTPAELVTRLRARAATSRENARTVKHPRVHRVFYAIGFVGTFPVSAAAVAAIISAAWKAVPR